MRYISIGSIALSLTLVACKGDGGNKSGNSDMAGNQNGGGNFAVVSRTDAVAPGSDCPLGGSKVLIGLDNGDGGGTARDGVLQDGEADKTELLCNPQPTAFGTLTTSTPLKAGDTHCLFGGARIDYGIDDGAGGGTASNGTLETDEIDGSTYVCLSQPANLLVQTIALSLGDKDCPYGGQRVRSGLDDGAPGGTANDGLLDPAEIDLDQARCNAAPEATFPPVTGTAGTAFIDVSGGDATGTSEGSAVGGPGGSIQVIAFGGSLPLAVDTQRAGTVTAATTAPAVAFTAGDHPVSITVNTTIDIVDVGSSEVVHPAGLHFAYESGPISIGQAPSALLYDGDVLQTSLEVQDGVRLTINSAIPGVRATVSGDLRNLGRITSAQPGGVRQDLYLGCTNFFNTPSGIVDLRGDPRAGLLDVYATGVLHNHGVLRTDGYAKADAAGPGYPTDASPLTLVAGGDLWSDKMIDASGGIANQAGPTILVRTLGGNIVNGGRINASGGAADDRVEAGTIQIFNGDSLTGGLIDREIGRGGLRGTKPGSFESTGQLVAHGGIANGAGINGGKGGTIVVRMVGGAVRMTDGLVPGEPIINVRGGDTAATNFGAGWGGTVYIGAYTWVDQDGTITVPDDLALAGSIDARGATGVVDSDNVFGGFGGQVKLILDLSLTGSSERGGPGKPGVNLSAGPGGPGPGPGGDLDPYAVRTSYNLDLLAASGKLPRVRLLGYGGDFLANAGDSANQFSSSANNGGTIAIGQHVCESDCSLPKIGVRVVRNAVNLQAHGGASVGSGGNGGSVSLLLEGQRNLLVATVDASAVEQSGTIDVEGGAGAATNGWSGSGGQVQIGTDTGDVKQSGAIEASGGASDVVANTFQPGAGGRIQLGGFAIANSATIAARGGQTPRNVGQRGGIYLTGYLVTNSATLETSGAPLVSTFVGDPVTDDEGVGEIVLHAVGTLENTATLVANGLGRSWDTEAQSAGGIIKLRGASVHDTMALSATGAACADATDGYAGKGGLLVVAGTTIELTGALTANGAACGKGNTLSNAGDGGTIFLRGVVSGSVVLNARGADEPASGTNSYGGSGGLVDWTGAALGTIDAQGGKVTPTASPINYALGGNGGVVKVSGNNAAAIQARGGNGDGATTTSGGDGGRVTVGGSNSACIDVSVGLAIGGSSNGDSGVITPADLPNFCL